MSAIDIQYLHTISHKLDRFKKKSQNLYNFRCPYCGDSQKKKTKARGFVYRVKNDMFYKCHNCGKGTTVGKLIEYLDVQLYKKYVVEKYKTGNTHSTKEPDFDFKPVKFKDKVLKDLPKFSELPKYHPALNFIYKRKLEDHIDRFYFVNKFMTWVNTLVPNKFPIIKEDHPRVVIPFFDVNGTVFAFQGRAFGSEEPKYITIKLDDNKRRIYGLDRMNVNKQVKIVEGPIDSLFLDNAIALAGADANLKIQPQQCTMIFDNEPRNKEIVKRMINAVNKKYNVAVFPNTLKYKDINDMIIAGKTSAEIQTLIYNNTHCGMTALQHINNWKRI